MKPARLLAFALAVAILPSGLAAALSACAMGGCEIAMTSENHDCCPDVGAELDAARCGRSRAAPATQQKPPERPGASHGVVALASVAGGAHRSPPAARARIAAAAFASTFPLDGLAQSCILRI